MADVVTPVSLPVYRAELPDCFVAQLQISLEGERERAATRPVYLTEDEFDLLHAMMASPPDVELMIDMVRMTPEQQRAASRQAWSRASRAAR